MSHDPKALQAILGDAVSPDMDVTYRAMFGGILGYYEGKPFASMSDVGLALKMTRDDDRAALMEVPGAAALQYDASQPVSKTYVVVPEAVLHDKKTLRAWIGRCVAGLKAAPAKNRRK